MASFAGQLEPLLTLNWQTKGLFLLVDGHRGFVISKSQEQAMALRLNRAAKQPLAGAVLRTVSSWSAGGLGAPWAAEAALICILYANVQLLAALVVAPVWPVVMQRFVTIPLLYRDTCDRKAPDVCAGYGDQHDCHGQRPRCSQLRREPAPEGALIDRAGCRERAIRRWC